jgi:outer membrane protein OmpA-like peptidoglycan-associated protein
VRSLIISLLVALPATTLAQPQDLTAPIATVTFDTGVSAVDDPGRDALRAVAEWAHDHPWRLIVVQAYADHTGGRTMNLTLSQERADAVRTQLLELGVASDRIVAASYGEEDPDAGRHVIVRGTLGDYRELLDLQHEPHTPAPRAPPVRPPLR